MQISVYVYIQFYEHKTDWKVVQKVYDSSYSWVKGNFNFICSVLSMSN
jgi:hypothetical protein